MSDSIATYTHVVTGFSSNALRILQLGKIELDSNRYVIVAPLEENRYCVEFKNDLGELTQLVLTTEAAVALRQLLEHFVPGRQTLTVTVAD